MKWRVDQKDTNRTGETPKMAILYREDQSEGSSLNSFFGKILFEKNACANSQDNSFGNC